MAWVLLDEVAEWLRRWTANPMCSAREGSNPFLVGIFTKLWHVSLHIMVVLFFGCKKSLPIPGIEPGPPG